MPVYGLGSPAYTFTADSSWIKVVDDGGTVVYGYNAVLGPDEETATALCDSMTMVNMSGSEFLAMTDVNIRLIGYLADIDEYGDEPAAAWGSIGE